MNETRGGYRATVALVGGMAVGAVCLAAAVSLERQLGPLAYLNLVAAVLGVGVSTGAARRWIAGRTEERPRRRKRLLLVGAGPMAWYLARQAEEEDQEVLGYLGDAGGEDPADRPATLLGPRTDVGRLARDLGADRVVVIDSPAEAWRILRELESAGVASEVHVVPEHYELALCPPTNRRLGDVPLFALPRRRTGTPADTAKRVMDVALSALLLVLFGPLMLLAMLAIRLCSPGPALFWQERVGKDGRRFELVKLRTMVLDAEAEGPRFCAGTDDPRLTSVGKFLRKTHLDELPQLLNVLRGEMSLVGPRPERPCFVEVYERELPGYADRHRVLPGITGLAQVNGYYHSTAREKLRYDLMYLYHRTLWMDLCILARTALSVLD